MTTQIQLETDDDAMKMRFRQYAERIRMGRLTVISAEFRQETEEEMRTGEYVLTLRMKDSVMGENHIANQLSGTPDK